MKMRFCICVAVTMGVLARGTRATAQDLTITSRVTREKNPPGTSVSYIASDHVRIAVGDGQEFIVDFKSGQMTTLDGRAKTYYVTTMEDLEKLAAVMQERMKDIPPEQRKQMNAAMGSGMASAFDVKKTGAIRKIAGYPCEVWTLAIGQFSKSEECLSSELSFPVQAWEMYRGFGARMQAMMASGPMAKGMEEIQKKFKNMKGYPLAKTTTISVMGHTTVITSEVTDVRMGPIPSSAWEVPAGYNKVYNPMSKAFSRSK